MMRKSMGKLLNALGWYEWIIVEQTAMSVRQSKNGALTPVGEAREAAGDDVWAVAILPCEADRLRMYPGYRGKRRIWLRVKP